MNKNIQTNKEEENKIMIFEDNKSSTSIPKEKLFISQSLNISEKDNQYRKKRYIKFISFKKPYFKVENKSVLYRKKFFHNPNINDGRWTEEEKNRFIQGITLYGINWKKVKTLIPTRSDIQIRSHAQKYFHKMKLCKDENLGIDFTVSSVKNIRDMINQIKSKNPNYNIMFILKKLSSSIDNRRFCKKIKKIKYKRYNNNNKSKNEVKNELIKSDENNNYINNNYTLNQNDTNRNLFENNIINQTFINNYFNNLLPNNNIQFSNTNIIDNNIINNNESTFWNMLNSNTLNLNLQNDILSNNLLDKGNNNNNLLNDHIGKTFKDHPYFKYLCLINNLLISRIKVLDSFNSIDNFCLLNTIQDMDPLNNNNLMNNKDFLINKNNNFLIHNNNNFLINNNMPIIYNNNLAINNNDIQIEKNIPLINNKSIDNVNKENNNNILIKINEKDELNVNDKKKYE